VRRGLGAAGDRDVDAAVAVLIQPDGHVAWVGDGTRSGLEDALALWFGPPAAAID